MNVCMYNVCFMCPLCNLSSVLLLIAYILYEVRNDDHGGGQYYVMGVV